MIGHLYRYPHPSEPNKFIYVGQGAKRDNQHRSGRSSFGRRFKVLFPDLELPQPIRWIVETRDWLELNELETIWMFRYHTWRGYGGMNLTLPGSDNYKNLGEIGGAIGGLVTAAIPGHLTRIRTSESTARGGRVGGRKNADSGHCNRINKLPKAKAAQRANGRIAGRIAVESGQLRSMVLAQGQGRKNSESGQCARLSHVRWHVRRGIKKAGCNFCEVI